MNLGAANICIKNYAKIFEYLSHSDVNLGVANICIENYAKIFEFLSHSYVNLGVAGKQLRHNSELLRRRQGKLLM